MEALSNIKNALISVFYKDGLAPIVQTLHQNGVVIYSTGGTQIFIEQLGIPVVPVEQLTGYPSILGGRVKTLHPKVFGGILARREEAKDLEEIAAYEIPLFDLVMVDLYPFEETRAQTNDEATIIEKIDIGGISLIRAAAKNFKHSFIVSDKNDYPEFLNLIRTQSASSTIEQRKAFAAKAFKTSSTYDGHIAAYFAAQIGTPNQAVLRYGENPHQKGIFHGNLDELFTKIQGKELSYNNILDIDAAMNLMADFTAPTVAIIKHNNPCGVASRATILEAWNDALAGDPVSAFGGVLVLNRPITIETAEAIDKIFFEVLIAPDFTEEAIAKLSAKKNRIILKQIGSLPNKNLFRSALNGMLEQEKDLVVLDKSALKAVTTHVVNDADLEDLIFADTIAKHTKSNTIVLAKNKQLLGIGCGQTSRVDALRHAIEKANHFNFDLKGAVMSSDAFFPFPDCVEIAHNAGIDKVVQPGGSIKDDASIAYCENNKMAMYLTGIRHFKH